ncbi:MAG TPA: helix-turn-helix domain-containing protein [Pseudonocardiaceae bacterium]
MKGLLLRLSGLDADAANAVRVIGFFDRLITGRVGLETLVRSTAQLAECPVGVSAPGRGLTLRAEPGADTVVSGRVPGHAASRELEDATVVWVAREGTPSPLDDMLLERFAIATAVLLDHASVPLPALGDPALVELVLSDGVGTAERSRALHLLGLDPMGGLRVVAGFGVDAIEGRAAGLGPARALLVIGAVPDVPPGGRLGIGPRVPAIEAARSWQAARTALRFAADSEPIVWWERLGSLAVLADRLDHADLAELPDVRALDRLAADPHGDDTVAVLDAICATGSARKAAAALHRHHSTMPARLAHAESVLGFALGTPADRFRLHLALLLRRLRDNIDD